MKRLLSKSTLVVLAVAFALGCVALTTQTWLVATVPSTAVQTPDIPVQGSQMATGVTAFALVAAAAALAAAISRPVLARICSALIVVASIAVVLNIVSFFGNPAGAAAAKIGEATGIQGGEDTQLAINALPSIALLLAIAMGLVGVVMVIRAGLWALTGGTGARFERAGAKTRQSSTHRKDEAIDRWDDLSVGKDPTVD